MAEPPAGMPEGLSKMEQMKWKRDQQKQAAAGACSSCSISDTVQPFQ